MSSSGGDRSRDGGSSADPAGGGTHHGCPTIRAGWTPLAQEGPSGRGQKAARAASKWPTAQVQDRGGETRPRTAQGKGREGGLEAVAPVKEAQGSPHMG